MKACLVLLSLLLTSVCTHADETARSKADAAQEWRSYVEPLLPIGGRMAALMPDSESPQLRQELYRQLFSGISRAYLGLFLGDPEHPDFVPHDNQASNFLAPNPDDSYYLAPIAGSGIYRISGYRGTVRLVDVQIGSGPLLPSGFGMIGPNLASHDLDGLHIKRDGSFDVILSAKRPAGYSGDWWPLGPAASYLLIRQISYDWLHEVDGRFAIDRLDRPAIRPRPDAGQIDANLRAIPQWTESWNAFALKWVNNYQTKGLVNKLYAHDLSAVGGVGAQTYIEGGFEINPDEALIYETEIPSKCRYWNVQLNDMLWATIDYTNRQSHLNGHTARLDKDGKFRAVIAASDPGVPNWLDSAGYTRGTLLGRWTNCSSSPVPTLTRVKLADVRKYLPAETPLVSEEARDAAIRLRRKGAQLRRRW